MHIVYDEKIQDYVCHADKLALRVCEVTPQTDYTLLLTFSNGEKRIYNALPLLDYKVFAPLKKLSFFLSAHLDACTVIWNDYIDIAPESLYDNSIPY